MIKVILWDIDGTLLDFEKAEKQAIRTCFEVFHLGECTDEMIARYSVINKGYWERLERKEMTKPQILVERFKEFFETEGIVTDCAERFNKEYQIRLGDTICFRDDGYELVKNLKSEVKQYAVTNGTKVAQDKKLNKSGLIDLFDGVFISEDIGVEKPDVKFFEHIWECIGQYEKDEVIIVGDSLTSDMRGGNNAGILCCWYNPKGLVNDKFIKINYEIKDLREILTIMDIENLW
jgi:2-haloacid dehalogenase